MFYIKPFAADQGLFVEFGMELEHDLGTPAATCLNAPDGFGADVAATRAELTGRPFRTAPTKFAAQGSR